MKFGPVPIEEAVGCIAAHSVRQNGVVLKKGAVVSDDHVAALRAAGETELVVARLEASEIMEDEAAQRIARAVGGEGTVTERPFTGRCNLFAAHDGLLLVERASIDAINEIDEAVTLATLPPFRLVSAGDMVATVKIIPFAVAEDVVRSAETAALRSSPVLRIAPWRVGRVGVISTITPGLQAKVIEKTLRVFERRLAPVGAAVHEELRLPHDAVVVGDALSAMVSRNDLVVIFGGSAITDRRDVIPSAIEKAGGFVSHLGMPVDPGNLLALGAIGDVSVIGAPGCARSPKENGFDWVLYRLLAGVPVKPRDITQMGVGGLLVETTMRPQPRLGETVRVPQIAALVLAAGRGSRMGGDHLSKMVARIDGHPMIRLAVESAISSRASPVIVVTGHKADLVREALAGLDVRFVHNADFAEGLSSSLRSGIAAVPAHCDGAIVMLGDMPRVSPRLINQLVEAYQPQDGIEAVVPVRDARRGNPVLFARSLFDELKALSGDVGGRGVLGRHGDAVAELETEDDAIFLDVDTQAALSSLTEL
ncbi:4-diphosphocytidyl-2C-methyl-D-erythritol kinase [Agaricicola taiwanensis]|uniref:4-diphosphocytidyl-2C-methyl-D-erythritol kinase n=1 Tax=Agaricicola taiwanensis TaxID=591372 RepID=A0A8J2VP34_9RHOB|nr:molybdopterin-binding/glycosyltransferase family 2 protein [Agaricicola taiwanensis]GGE42020.1 4-diphosphocytidyl-2C-methyl-D-erythritol kinase [Agaricicola taiwanensis]